MRAPTDVQPHLDRGFTLVEMLVVVVLLAIVARITVSSLNGNDVQRLEAASVEVRAALRFAREEAMRRGKKTLVDAESSPGQIKLFVSPYGCSSSSVSSLTDPRTKSAYVLNITGGAFSSGVMVAPQFLASGVAYGGLIFDTDGTPSDVCQVTGTNSKGAPQAGSNVMLTLGQGQATVSLDAVTGRITIP